PIHLKTAIVVVGVIVCGVQVYWADSASRADLEGEYSASAEIARVLRERGLEDKNIVATTFWSTAVQPYFDHNIFANHRDGQPPAYWKWANPNGHEERIDALLAGQPDVLLIGRPPPPPESYAGYRLLAVFEGNLYWKDRVKESNHFAVYLRDDDAPLEPPQSNDATSP
ncbi:MAG: hypothetical protein O3A46_07155, partial [Candidatus Poribacteria bacterium]|nr:hypothetical protein [Candidatus Poribacteria bacterium]